MTMLPEQSRKIASALRWDEPETGKRPEPPQYNVAPVLTRLLEGRPA